MSLAVQLADKGDRRPADKHHGIKIALLQLFHGVVKGVERNRRLDIVDGEQHRSGNRGPAPLGAHRHALPFELIESLNVALVAEHLYFFGVKIHYDLDTVEKIQTLPLFEHVGYKP